MNVKTGEIKELAKLSPEEKASPDWKELPDSVVVRGGIPLLAGRPASKSDIRRELYMEEVARKMKERLAGVKK